MPRPNHFLLYKHFLSGQKRFHSRPEATKHRDMKQSGARSAPGKIWGCFSNIWKFSENTKEMPMNSGARSAPGKILGCFSKTWRFREITKKTKGNQRTYWENLGTLRTLGKQYDQNICVLFPVFSQALRFIDKFKTSFMINLPNKIKTNAKKIFWNELIFFYV